MLILSLSLVDDIFLRTKKRIQSRIEAAPKRQELKEAASLLAVHAQGLFFLPLLIFFNTHYTLHEDFSPLPFASLFFIPLSPSRMGKKKQKCKTLQSRRQHDTTHKNKTKTNTSSQIHHHRHLNTHMTYTGLFSRCGRGHLNECPLVVASNTRPLTLLLLLLTPLLPVLVPRTPAAHKRNDHKTHTIVHFLTPIFLSAPLLPISLYHTPPLLSNLSPRSNSADQAASNSDSSPQA